MNSELSHPLGVLETTRSKISGMTDAELAEALLSPARSGRLKPAKHSNAVFEAAPRPFGPCFTGPVMEQLAVAIELLTRLMVQKMQERALLDYPAAVKEWLRLRYACHDHEVFAVLFLDSRHRLIAFQEMFRGTVNQTSVWPREIVKAAIAWSSPVLIVAHNHPSFSSEISRSDEFLTSAIRDALALVDIRLLDHMVVAGTEVRSFAEMGLL